MSVVMAVYNGERFLHEALESLLSQSVARLEVVVVDDGSTDATAEILRELTRKDDRLIVHARANGGRTSALNDGFALARAPLVARLDGDDIALPGRLERQRAFLDEHPDHALVGGAANFIDEHGRTFARVEYPIAHEAIQHAFAHTTPFVHSAVMVRKTAFLDVGGYRPIFSQGEDLDLWIRLAERHRAANLAEPLVRYRIHGNQATLRQIELQVLGSVAARLSARARAAALPDPLETMEQIDLEGLLAHGATGDEIVESRVRFTTWLAMTMARAGQSEISDELFASAGAEARRGAHASGRLRAHVHRERARSHSEQGRWLRARLDRLTAALDLGLAARKRAGPADPHRP